LLKQQAVTAQDVATIDAAFKELDDRQTKALVNATNAKDTYALANTPQEKQQAYVQLQSAYAELGDIAAALTGQGDGAGAAVYGKAALTTYLMLQVAAQEVGQPATPLTPAQRDVVAKQFLDLGIALDASDSAGARTALQKLNTTSPAAVINTQTSNGAANSATGVNLADSLAAQMAKPQVSNTQLANMMDDLYRDGAKVGSGSTADAVRYENQTGLPVGGVFHSEKASNYATGLQRWIENNPSAPASDISAAQNVLRDLLNALRGK
jgi:hypothetical protein